MLLSEHATVVVNIVTLTLKNIVNDKPKIEATKP